MSSADGPGHIPRPHVQGGFLVTKVHHLSRRVLGRLLRARGVAELNPGQGRILFALWQGDGITVTELAGRTSLEKSTLTRMLDRLERDRMVERVRPPENRRTVRVALTPQARGRLGTFAEVSQDMGRLFYKGIPDHEIHAFEATLERVLANLEAAETNGR